MIIRAKTSASNLFRRAECPGSEAAEAPFAEQNSEYSSEGTLLHKWFFVPEKPIALLTKTQLETLNEAETYARKAFLEFATLHGIPDDALAVDNHEVELDVHDTDGTPLPPGHADLVRFWPEYDLAYIVDAKFGFSEVEEAPSNLQLADYALGVFQNSNGKLKEIGVAIVQPRNFGERLTTARYSPAALDAALAEIRRISDACKPEGAPRAAGDWCTYCKAKVACDTYKARMGVLATLPDLTAVAALSNEQIVALLRAIQTADRIKNQTDLFDEARKRILAGQIDGKLQNTGDTRTMFDMPGAFAAVNAYLKEEGHNNLTARAFESTLKPSFGDLEALFIELTGMTQKKGKEILKEVTAPFCISVEKTKRIVLAK